jgi:hypothetical protein
MPPPARIALIGFGEAAAAFRTGWAGRAPEVAAFDIKSEDPQQAEAMTARFASRGGSRQSGPAR